MSNFKTKVLILCPYPNYNSGVPKALLDNFRAFHNPRLEIYLYTPRAEALVQDLRAINYPHIIIDRFFPDALKHNLFSKKNFFTQIVSIVANFLLYAALIVRLSYRLRRGGFHLLVVNCLFPKLLSPFVSILSGIPVVWHVRSYRAGKFYMKWLAFWLQKPRVRKAIAISKFSQSQFQISLREKVEVIYDGMDFSQVDLKKSSRGRLRADFKIHQDRVIIGIVGRVARIKGGLEFLEAVKIVREKYPNVLGIFFGETPKHHSDTFIQECRAWISKNQFSDHVLFAGYVREMYSYFPDIDILVQPSFLEPLGRTVMEAMAFQIPVVGSQSGGILDLIVKDGLYGKFCRPKNPASLAEAILYILEHPEEARKMTVNARIHLESLCDHNRIAGRLEEMFLECSVTTQKSCNPLTLNP